MMILMATTAAMMGPSVGTDLTTTMRITVIMTTMTTVTTSTMKNVSDKSNIGMNWDEVTFRRIEGTMVLRLERGDSDVDC